MRVFKPGKWEVNIGNFGKLVKKQRLSQYGPNSLQKPTGPPQSLDHIAASGDSRREGAVPIAYQRRRQRGQFRLLNRRVLPACDRG